jgi:hypothetical protein
MVRGSIGRRFLCFPEKLKTLESFMDVNSMNLFATLLLYREGKISVRDACVRLDNAGGDSIWLAEMLEKALEMAKR